MNKYSLGIDTSNYKTSMAVTDQEGNIIWNKSEFLDVKKGELGLRQSVAFFKHSNILPDFVNEVFETVNPAEIACVAVSTRPRSVEGSYMPVFLAGQNIARTMSKTLGVSLYEFSHQEGHIEAILSDFGYSGVGPVCVFHLSGGTTEALICKREGYHINAEIVGGTKDISIGQLLDRVGVSMGFSFPAGGYLDEIAMNSLKINSSDYKQKGNSLLSDMRKAKNSLGRIKIDDGYFNLSGIETKALRMSDEEKRKIVPDLFDIILKLLLDEIEFIHKKYKIDNFYMAGGVAASEYMRISAPDLNWGSPVLSGDNAVGISLLGGKAYNETSNGLAGN